MNGQDKKLDVELKVELYHYTNQVNLPGILLSGIRNIAHVSSVQPEDRVCNGRSPEELGVWLTSDSNPRSQGWGAYPLAVPHAFDKAAVRIALIIPAGESALRRWRDYAEEIGVPRRVYRGLDESGSWGAKHWWLWTGAPIPVEWIRTVEVRGSVVDRKDIASAKAHRLAGLREFRRRYGSIPVDVELFPDEVAELTEEPKCMARRGQGSITS
jgi:hypothetical protein